MNKIIVVEGKTDITFLKYLFKNMKLEVDIENENNYKASPLQIGKNLYISNLEGCNGENRERLRENFQSLLESPENFLKIIYILDADKNFSKVENMIKNLNNEKVSYYIFPNNKDSGMLEDVLLKIATKESLVKLIEDEILQKLKDNDQSEIRKEAKSKMMIYLASSTPLKESLKDALQAKKLWNFSHSSLDEIKIFFNEALKESDEKSI
ncbi:MAG: DUF3226 domain-containing protein [Fusobacteriaceae bacterium]